MNKVENGKIDPVSINFDNIVTPFVPESLTDSGLITVFKKNEYCIKKKCLYFFILKKIKRNKNTYIF